MITTDARDRAQTKMALLELVQHALIRASARGGLTRTAGPAPAPAFDRCAAHGSRHRRVRGRSRRSVRSWADARRPGALEPAGAVRRHDRGASRARACRRAHPRGRQRLDAGRPPAPARRRRRVGPRGRARRVGEQPAASGRRPTSACAGASPRSRTRAVTGSRSRRTTPCPQPGRAGPAGGAGGVGPGDRTRLRRRRRRPRPGRRSRTSAA